MSQVWSPLVDLRRGERRPALRAFLLLSVLIGGHTLMETARDALFLGALPASRLAIVYALIAGLALIVSGPNARFVRRVGEGRALFLTLLGAAAGTGALYLLPGTPAVAFAVYVWSAFLATVMVVQCWVFLAQVFTPSQGKRLFGLIAAGGVAGAVAGAAAGMLALSFFPVRSLLSMAAFSFVTAALLSAGIEPPRARDEARAPSAPPPLVRRGARDEAPARSTLDGPPPSSGRTGELPRGLALFRSHPYFAWLAALTALSTAAVLATDYLFKADAARRIASEDLGAYFARSYACFNGAALVIQVLVAAPLVRRVGVTRALIVMPLLLLGGASLVLFTGAPAAVLITKGVDGALRHSLHRVTSELLGLPISADLRARVKPALDGGLTRAVQATMAAALFALTISGHASSREIAALVLCLALAWLIVSFAIRRPHLDMFRHAIDRGRLAEARPELDAKLVEVVVETLSSGDPARVVAAMDLLEENGWERLIPAAVLRHGSEDVQVHALDLMARTGQRDWAAEARQLLAGAPERVRIAAVRALAAASVLDAVRASLGDASPAVRAHAAVALARAEAEGDAASSSLIQEILDTPGEPGRAGRLALLDAIRDRSDRRFSEVLLAMTARGDPEVKERIVLAMASVRDPRFIGTLVRELHIRSVRVAVRDALVDLGEPAQEALEHAMRSEATEPAVRLHIPRTLCRFGNQRAADFLTQQLAIEPSRLVRYKVLRGLGRLVASTDVRVDRAAILGQLRANLIEHLDALARWVALEKSPATRASQSGRLLLGLLSDKMSQSLERAFRLLHIAYRREDLRHVFLALGSADRRGRESAVEFLDALTSGAHGEQEREVRDLLELVIDDLPPREKVRRAAREMGSAPEDAEEAVRMLLHDRDTSLAALAAYHAVELQFEGARDEVERAARDRPSLLEMASDALYPETRAAEVSCA